MRKRNLILFVIIFGLGILIAINIFNNNNDSTDDNVPEWTEKDIVYTFGYSNLRKVRKTIDVEGKNICNTSYYEIYHCLGCSLENVMVEVGNVVNVGDYLYNSSGNALNSSIHGKVESIVDNGVDIFIEISNFNETYIELMIKQDEYTNVKIEQQVIIKFSDNYFMGEVTFIGEFVQDNGYIEVRIDPDQNDIILPGANVKLSLIIIEKDEVITVPKNSLFADANGEFVYIIDSDNNLIKRYITVGIRGNDYIEIIDGILPGEKVLLSDD